MAKRTCSVDGCERPGTSLGLCYMHYNRVKRHGSPGSPAPILDHGRTPEQRFLGFVEEQPNGCWHWTGAIHPKTGYARFWAAGDRFAHRWSYEHFVGPIPDGLVVDHLCRVRHCVNPDHMEPVTYRENCLRGVGPSARNAKKRDCDSGHPLIGDNLYICPRGTRKCKQCRRDAKARYRAKLRARGRTTRVAVAR